MTICERSEGRLNNPSIIIHSGSSILVDRSTPTRSRSAHHRDASREEYRDFHLTKKAHPKMAFSVMSSMKLFVLFLLCMQNTMFTVLRRYSQGVLKENYSKVSRYK